MNAKKILALLLGAMMLLSLAACGAKDNDKQADMSGDSSAMTGEPKTAEEALALHKELLERENAILSENTELWEKVFLEADKGMAMIEDGKNYGDFLLDRRVAHGGRLPVSEALRRQRRRDRRELPDPHFPLRRGSLFPALAHGRGDPLLAGRHGLHRTAPVHRVRRRARRPRDAAPGVRDKLTAAREETKKASEKGHSLPFSDAFCMMAALRRAKAPTGAVVRSACFCGGLRGGRCAARSLSPDRCAQGYPCAYK